jgi:uncharacterized Tic20 family protein
VSDYAKLSITAHGLLILDFVMIFRYIFIFWLKNPAMFNDEFWIVFINLWIFLFAWLSQLVIILGPGRPYVNYYICTGRDPTEDQHLGEKNLQFNVGVKVFSILLHVLLSIRIKVSCVNQPNWWKTFRV